MVLLWSVLQGVAVCCSVLQCAAHHATHCVYVELLAAGRHSQCCSVLQCAAVCCSVLQCVQCVAVCCSVLQCVAVCCSVLPCVAVRCMVLFSVSQCVTMCRAVRCRSREFRP